MDNSISHALTIMAVGMVTVFFILYLVVLIGNVLIHVTNRYSPDVVTTKKQPITHSAPNRSVAAIVTAVDIVTGGKGKVTHIKKLN